MKNDAETVATPAAEPESVVDAKAENPVIPKSGPVIDAWVQDLIGNIPHLRTAEAYNTLRAAADDLKRKLG